MISLSLLIESRSRKVYGFMLNALRFSAFALVV